MPCEQCGATGRNHAHHDDYAKPLQIRWLCPKCHGAFHASQHTRKERVKTGYPATRKSRANPSPKRDEFLTHAKLLQIQGMTYQQISDKIQVSKGTVYKWLNDTAYN